MATITASLAPRTRRLPVPVTAVPAEDDHQPQHEVPGPGEHSLARTTAAVTTSLVLLIGTVIASAYGVGSLALGLLGWFMD